MAGESNTLGFAAGKGWGGSGKAEVGETDFEEEAESGVNFFEGFAGDEGLEVIELEGLEELEAMFEGEFADFGE